jgi:prolipoprotein diacylglyceryltransferase
MGMLLCIPLMLAGIVLLSIALTREPQAIRPTEKNG